MAAEHARMDDVDPDLPDLQAAARGDGAACRRLVDRYLRRLHAYAVRILDDRDEADDVCQDAFVSLWQVAPKWRTGEARISTWLHGVVVNGCRDRLRRRRPFDPVDRIDAQVDAHGAEHPGSLHDQRERRQMLHDLLQGLPERQREALVLFHLEGYSQEEAAQMLQVSTEALESLLARARRSLRAQVRSEGADAQ